MKYLDSVSELTPPLNFCLIPLKVESLIKGWTPILKVKNDASLESTGEVTIIITVLGTPLEEKEGVHLHPSSSCIFKTSYHSG